MAIRVRDPNSYFPAAHLDRCRALRNGEVKIGDDLKKAIDACVRKAERAGLNGQRCYALLMGLCALQTLIDSDDRRARVRDAQSALSIFRSYPSIVTTRHKQVLDSFRENALTNSQALIILGYVLSNSTTRFRAKRDWLPLAPALMKIFHQKRGKRSRWEGEAASPTAMILSRMRMRKRYLEEKARAKKDKQALSNLHYRARICFQQVYATFQQ